MASGRIFRVPPIIHTGEGAAARAGEGAGRLGAAQAGAEKVREIIKKLEIPSLSQLGQA